MDIFETFQMLVHDKRTHDFFLLLLVCFSAARDYFAAKIAVKNVEYCFGKNKYVQVIQMALILEGKVIPGQTKSSGMPSECSLR